MRVMDEIALIGVDNANPKRALEVGKAAEHLVCADLILQGHCAFLSDQGLSYDVVADIGGRMVRIQVKATSSVTATQDREVTPKYRWHVRRIGKGGKRRVEEGAFDILALVALDIRQIAYIPMSAGVPQTIDLRPPGVRPRPGSTKPYFRKCVDQYPFAEALEGVLK